MWLVRASIESAVVMGPHFRGDDSMPGFRGDDGLEDFRRTDRLKVHATFFTAA